MKFLTLIISFLILTTHVCAKDRRTYLGLSGNLSTSDWDRVPVGYTASDLAPPEMTFHAGVWQKNNRSIFDIEMQLSYIDLLSQSFSLDSKHRILLAGDGFMSLLFGWDFFIPIFQGNSKLDDTQYDHFRIGGYAGFGIYNEVLELKFTLGVRQVFTSTLANFEGVETEIAHDANVIYRLSALAKLGQMRLLGEMAVIDSGLTTIISKEFFFRVPEEKANQLTFGVGYQNDKNDLWIKMNKILNIDDQTAHYYNLPYFMGDYMLSEESVSMEYMWKF